MSLLGLLVPGVRMGGGTAAPPPPPPPTPTVEEVTGLIGTSGERGGYLIPPGNVNSRAINVLYPRGSGGGVVPEGETAEEREARARKRLVAVLVALRKMGVV